MAKTVDKKKPVQQKKNIAIMAMAVVLVGIGTYCLLAVLSPFAATRFINPDNNGTTQKLEDTKDEIVDNRLYIPKIDINLPYATGNETVMETGAWWRSPSSGNPKDGGNFVLSAHRFVMGWTPGETVKRSPFYNIHKLEIGDTMTVDYEGKRYVYTIEEKHSVAPTAIEIEAPTEDDRLTLYSCGLGGASDKREVLIAKLVS